MVFLGVVFVMQRVYSIDNKKFNLNPTRILRDHQFYRLFTSAVLHRNIQHIGLNLLSVYSSAGLERELGPHKFLMTTLISLIFTPLIYCVLANIYNSVMEEPIKSTKGWSGVIFHWTARECMMDPNSTISLFDVGQVPSAYYPWALMAILQMMDARSSWLLHTTGILTGSAQFYLEEILSDWKDRSLKRELESTPLVQSPPSVDPTAVREARLERLDNGKQD